MSLNSLNSVKTFKENSTIDHHKYKNPNTRMLSSRMRTARLFAYWPCPVVFGGSVQPHIYIPISEKVVIFPRKMGNLPKSGYQEVEKRWKKFHLKFYFLPLNLGILYSTKIGRCVGICAWLSVAGGYCYPVSSALPSSNLGGLRFHWLRWNRSRYIYNTVKKYYLALNVVWGQ